MSRSDVAECREILEDVIAAMGDPNWTRKRDLILAGLEEVTRTIAAQPVPRRDSLRIIPMRDWQVNGVFIEPIITGGT